MTAKRPPTFSTHARRRAAAARRQRPITRRASFIAADLLVAVGLALTIIIIFTSALHQYVSGQNDADARRVLRLEAENYLHRVRVLGPDAANVPTQPVAPPASDITLAATESAATGDWSGFTRITVTARKRVTGGRWIAVDLSTYVPAPRDRP